MFVHYQPEDPLPFRVNLIDAAGTVSVGVPGHGVKVLTAACASGPTSVRELLEAAGAHDADMVRRIRDGLAVFDEHCLGGDPSTWSGWLDQRDLAAPEPFRVVNEATRRASLVPRRLGLVMFNLTARRIVQVENRYGALLREDRGRIRERGRPVQRFYRYRLPDEWRLVP